ncbi:Phosphoglycolate phosphatase 2, partial [Durusdinium trenchii]
MGSSSSGARAEPQVVNEESFKVTCVGHSLVNDTYEYDFFVQPPASTGAPGQTVRRSFKELQRLGHAMSARWPRASLRTPSRPFFEVPGEQGEVMERSLRAMLSLEPFPRSTALRHFLGIAMPPPADLSDGHVAGHWRLGAEMRLPLGAAATVMSFCEAHVALKVCTRVCKALQAAVLHPTSWPRLTVSSRVAERCIDSLCRILWRTCVGVQVLTLDLTFQQGHLGVALPAQLLLRQLRSLTLRLGDPEAQAFACDLLSCVESPKLWELRLSAQLTAQLLNAASMALLPTEQPLRRLALTALPDARLGAGTVAAVRALLDSAPRVADLAISVEDAFGGDSRWFERCGPLETPVLQTMMALNLESLTFDFLSDELLLAISSSSDRALWPQLRRAKLSGCKRVLEDPDGMLGVLLSKLGEELEEFALLIDLEVPVRSFSAGILHQRLGSLPNWWQERANLRSLELNWHAFDDEGIASLVEGCPQLEVLLLDRAEYWTDNTMSRLLESLPHLHRLRLRQSSMMSDRALYELLQTPQRLVLEIEPSYAMSSYVLDQLNPSFHSTSNLVEVQLLKPQLDEEETLWPDLSFNFGRCASHVYIGAYPAPGLLRDEAVRLSRALRVFSGHQPHGESPTVVRHTRSGLLVVTADTSYSNMSALKLFNQSNNRGEVVTNVRLRGGRVQLEGILRDGSKHRCELHVDPAEAPIPDALVGCQLNDGSWVKTVLEDGRVLAALGKRFQVSVQSMHPGKACLMLKSVYFSEKLRVSLKNLSAEWLLESQKHVQLLPGPEPSGTEAHDHWYQATQFKREEFDSAETYIFDGHGTLWGVRNSLGQGVSNLDLEEQVIQKVNSLIAAGKQVIFATNDSNYSRRLYIDRLLKHGIRLCHDDEFSRSKAKQKVVTAAFTCAWFLKKALIRKPFVICSHPGLLEELREAGITDYVATIDHDGRAKEEYFAPVTKENVTKLVQQSKDVDAIVVGWDQQLTALKVAVAAAFLKWSR